MRFDKTSVALMFAFPRPHQFLGATLHIPKVQSPAFARRALRHQMTPNDRATQVAHDMSGGEVFKTYAKHPFSLLKQMQMSRPGCSLVNIHPNYTVSGEQQRRCFDTFDGVRKVIAALPHKCMAAKVELEFIREHQRSK